MTVDHQIVHASCVAIDGRGLLILGPSGVGKSGLAIRMIGLGATLVSDDRTRLDAMAGQLTASCPNPDLSGLVEARGLGIVRAPASGPVTLALAVDLGQVEPDRLPPTRTLTLMGIPLRLVLHPQNDHFPDALMLYLRHGRQA